MKMTAKEIEDFLGNIVSGLYFEWNNKDCGIDPLDIKHFDMWCGQDMISVDSIDKVMCSPFFDGKCLREIAENIVI